MKKKKHMHTHTHWFGAAIISVASFKTVAFCGVKKKDVHRTLCKLTSDGQKDIPM